MNMQNADTCDLVDAIQALYGENDLEVAGEALLFCLANIISMVPEEHQHEGINAAMMELGENVDFCNRFRADNPKRFSAEPLQ